VAGDTLNQAAGSGESWPTGLGPRDKS